MVDKIILDEKEQKKKEAEAKEKAKLASAEKEKEFTLDPSLDENSTFALTNPTAIVSGIAEFRKVWGTRKLEDNWRRSQRDNTAFNNNEENQEEETTENTVVKDSTEQKENQEEKVNKDLYYKDIPYTAAQLDSSNKRIETALYKIGKIYDQKLEEPVRSTKTYDNLLSRYSKTEYKPEVYYSMHLIYSNKLNDKKNAELYRNKLLSEFPHSLYAKLLKNPHYLQDNQVANMKAHEKYKDAFDLYRNGQHKACDSLIKIIREEFPDNDIDDKLELLGILNFGQTGSPLVYKSKLEEFIDNYAASALAVKAKELLEATDNFINKKSEKGEAVTATDVKFSTDLVKPHLLVAVFPEYIPLGKVQREFQIFTKSQSDKQKLGVEIKPFSDSTYIVVVKGFEEKFPAQVYINNLKDEKSFFQKNGYIDHPVFIISNYNYQLFLDSKNLNGYLKFYKDNY